ncbi:hypothetical protein FRB98_004256 [Tulasnella sp. 332]|nr:hypothetical protein FRB98_004256 [Tulasnella sp. 332]
MAVVNVHLTLDYEPPRQHTDDLQARLVAGHMRIAYSVPQEPTARQMYANQSDPGDVVKILVQLLQGFLDKGGRGDLIPRLLLMFTYDAAIQHDQSEIITAVIASSRNNKVCAGEDGEVGGGAFREVFENATVRFAHFGKMGNTAGTTAFGAYSDFLRGMAIMCPNG